ncbi:MAG: hypothetical protein EXX96DRAFT_544502 [Benjaminiella poitrasii]|nr:MAG: hypothetical protein EXX96DRAFT_544502 [Benjaminiella poitrasii]
MRDFVWHFNYRTKLNMIKQYSHLTNPIHILINIYVDIWNARNNCLFYFSLLVYSFKKRSLIVVFYIMVYGLLT